MQMLTIGAGQHFWLGARVFLTGTGAKCFMQMLQAHAAASSSPAMALRLHEGLIKVHVDQSAIHLPNQKPVNQQCNDDAGLLALARVQAQLSCPGYAFPPAA